MLIAHVVLLLCVVLVCNGQSSEILPSSVDNELDALNDQVSAVQSQSNEENNQLIDLTVSVTGQKSAVDKFNILDFKQIKLGQNKLNKRLAALDEKINVISQLRSQLKTVDYVLDVIRNKVQGDFIPHVDQLLTSSEERQTEDVERNNKIQELILKVHEDDNKTDSLFISEAKLSDELNRIVRDVQQVMIRISSVTAIEEQVDIELVKPGTVSTVARPITVLLTRAPRSAPSSIVGFNVVRNKNIRSDNSNTTNIISIKSQIIVSKSLIFDAEDNSQGVFRATSLRISTLVQ